LTYSNQWRLGFLREKLLVKSNLIKDIAEGCSAILFSVLYLSFARLKGKQLQSKTSGMASL
jgi:hypothetical protein